MYLHFLQDTQRVSRIVKNGHDYFIKRHREHGNIKMAVAHQALVKYVADLGYTSPAEGGMCFGLVHMWVQAILSNDLKSFTQRLQKIEHDILNNNALTLAQRYKAGIMHLLDGIEIYHKSTRHYRYLFDLDNRNVTFQQDALESAKLVSSIEIEKQGGLHKNAEFTGVYNKLELVEYFKTLQETLAKTQEPFAFVLDNVTHVIGVSYDLKTKKWLLCDANQLPIRRYARHEDLCEAIMRGFQVKANDQVIMNTIAYSTKINQHIHCAIIKQWKEHPIVKSMHQVTEQKATKISKNNDSWLFQATSINDLETVDALLKIKSTDRNLATKVGKFTPLHAAASNGSVDCLKLLMADDQVDMNSQTSDGSTALYIAVFSGHKDCVKLLLKNRKANPTLAVNNVTPLEAALHFHQFRIAWELLKDPRINNIDKLFKHPILHGLGMVYALLYIGYFLLSIAMPHLILGAIIMGTVTGAISWLLQKQRERITQKAHAVLPKQESHAIEDSRKQLIDELNKYSITQLESLQTGIQSGQSWMKYFKPSNFCSFNATWHYKHYLLGIKLSSENLIVHNKHLISNMIKRKVGTQK